MVVEALLEGGQRQDVPQRRAVQIVDVGLGERRHAEVAGRVAAQAECGQVECGQVGQSGEGLAEVPADGLDVLVGEQPVGPGEGGDQFVRAAGRGGFGDRVELQGARQPHPGVAPLAQLAGGVSEFPVAGGSRVEAAQVVEQHLGCGRVERGVGQVAQGAVGDAVARHPGEVLLDRLECGDQGGGGRGVGGRAGVDGHREQGGEPAHGP